ncbi:PE-PPE domain-containing protein [Mycobacterium sp.]|uniref:PE-PPE domain-containing protein n=1 Tax=Mycobacterium sp. TaxID=1785 RepID=UPI0025D84F71|nr:PE-PPE domain-containing protein [Mycobacterium sp.]
MKKAILGAALCGAAIALASPASADSNSDFWNAASGTITDWLLGASSTSDVSAEVSSLAARDSDFLDGSTNALILGATGMPTPTSSYINAAASLYIFPNGYEGDNGSLTALTTPQTFDFFPSVQDGKDELVNAIMEQYKAGEMGCNAAGICSDPLTIFTYSQSAAIAALAQRDLDDMKVPDDALRFIMLGANPLGVPDNLYPTEIFNIDGDVWAQPFTLGSNWQEILMGFALHEVYLGLTEEQIGSASTIVDGMTTIHEIPTLTWPELIDALFNVWFGQ